MNDFDHVAVKLAATGENALLAMFQGKVEAARSVYMPNIKRLKKQSAVDQETDKLIADHSKKVRAMFERKKAKAIDRIKQMQDKFGVKPLAKKAMLVETTNQAKKNQDEELVCAVSREKLSSKQTYSILASFHLTNVSLYDTVTRVFDDQTADIDSRRQSFDDRR